MAFTYKWSDLIALSLKFVKNIPITTIDEQICDLVNSEVWCKYPWRYSRTTIAAGSLPCVDGTQDYSTPPNIFRLLKCRLVRTDTTPDQIQELDVQNDLDPDPQKVSFRLVRVASLQQDVGQIRLQSAVSVPSGVSLEIQGEYQRNAPKIVSLSDQLWFADHFQNVAIEGLKYWLYKLSDDSRAGSVQERSGTIVRTGQYASFHAAIDVMWAAEEMDNTEQFFPDTPLGVGRSTGTPSIFGV